MPESAEETLRKVGGYADAVVARVDGPLKLSDGRECPGVERRRSWSGSRTSHPGARRPLCAELAPTNRLTASLSGLWRPLHARGAELARPLGAAVAPRADPVTEYELTGGFRPPDPLRSVAERRSPVEVEDADVLYLAGIPHRALQESGRARLRVTQETLQVLPTHTVVLSPLPVIDEIDRVVLSDPRFRMFQQSYDGIHVRTRSLSVCLPRGFLRDC
jgi:aspartate carbamoyltransferase catalytic subunit